MMVKLTSQIIIFCWIIFVAYWAVSSIGVKKNIRQRGAGGGMLWLRILMIVILIRLLPSRFPSLFRESLAFHNAVFGIIGVVLCSAGIAFAIWARRHLGRNWSSTPSIKEGHELVTSGPYRFVRHPIYTGMLLAILGSALAAGPVWLLVFLIAAAVFITRIKTEETYMMQLFPDQYPAYKMGTKALIPLVW